MDRLADWKAGITVDNIPVGDLTGDIFKRDYWMPNKPLLIKGAVGLWPASGKWKNYSYLHKNLSGCAVPVCRQALIEGEVAHSDISTEILSFDDFWQEIGNYSNDPIWLHAIDLALNHSGGIDHVHIDAVSDFQKLLSKLAAQDFGSFPFLFNISLPRFYPSWRVFLYRNSFTDWHPHVTDTHLMCQIVGDKEVKLIPPNLGYELIQPILENKIRTSDATKELQNKIEKAALSIVVYEGDVLHIPIHWYHCVKSDSAYDFGATLAYTFASPLRVNGDSRFQLNSFAFANASRKQKTLLLVARLIAWLQRSQPLIVDNFK